MIIVLLITCNITQDVQFPEAIQFHKYCGLLCKWSDVGLDMKDIFISL